MNEIPEEENPPLETTGLLGLFESPVKKEKDSSAGNDTGTPYSLTGSFNPLSPPPTKEITSYDDLDNATADIDAPAGSVSRMMAMFRVPPPINKDSSSQPTLERPSLERQSTAKRSNRMPLENSENTPLLDSSLPSHSRIPSWKDYFHISATDSTPKTSVTTRKQYLAESAKVAHTRMPSVAMPAISESSQDKQSPSRTTRWGGAIQHISSFLKTSVNEAMKPTTYIGSFMFLLYHVVFCLALGSAITRPNNPTSILGLMTKTSALGILAASIVYWLTLGPEIPALYPTVDLFLAPMLAHLAKIVDQTLAEDGVSGQENDTVFLATFGVLSGIGIAFSGLIIYLATIFKLANLGSFLVSFRRDLSAHEFFNIYTHTLTSIPNQ